MARSKRQKLDRTNNAAYAASQPLFSALRNASASLDTTKTNLALARDIVQTIHVKIANDDSHNDASRHEAYMKAAVKAWTSSTEAFCKVFEELVKVTAAEPTEGREAGARYEELVAMSESVKRARELASNFHVTSEETQVDGEVEAAEEPASFTNGVGKRAMAGPKSRGDESTANVQNGESPSLAEDMAEPINNRLAGLGGSRFRGDKLLWKNAELKVPFKTLHSEEKKEWATVIRRKREFIAEAKQKENRVESSVYTKNEAFGHASKEDSNEAAVPSINFEDVSAEVEARLKSKADKKAAQKAKKLEKKRKRESADSFGPNAGREDTLEPLDALEQSISDMLQKPSKKKAKKAAKDEAASSKDGANTTFAKKRKNLESQTDMVDRISAKSSSKKRKKARN